MHTSNLVKFTFIIGYLVPVVGAFLKIMHMKGADLWLAMGVISFFVFVIAAIYEVATSKRINRSEKTMWIIGLLLLGWITGLIYYFSGRRRVVATVSTAENLPQSH